MTKILAAVVNPTYPTSFEDIGKLTDNYIGMTKDYLRYSDPNYDEHTLITFFPEYWISRINDEYDFENKRDLSILLEGKEPVPKASEEMEMMKDIARRHSCYISSGWIEQASSGNYLSALLIDPDGEISACQRKRHPVTEIAGVPLEVPSWKLKKGRGLGVYEGDDFSMGWLICDEINNPKLAEKLADRGVEIIHHPKGFNFNAFGSVGESWLGVERTRAKDMEAYLISNTNSLGIFNEDVPAQIVDFYGVGQSILRGEGIKYYPLDLERLRAYRTNPEKYPSRFSAPRVR
jgi:predicted amidohydrolase